MSINYINLPIIAIFLPFFTAFINALLGEKADFLKKALSIMAILIAVIAVVLMIKPIWIDGEIISYWMGNWVPEAGKAIGIGLEIDAFGLFVGLIIAVTCLISCIYSVRYMDKDNGLEKYYSLFMLLCASMIAFVFSGDLFNMYVMLEIMTFAAIGLTAFRNHKYKAIEAGFKYIVIGSLGSSLILLGTALIYSTAHTLNIAEISAILHNTNGDGNVVKYLALALMLTGYAVKAFLVPCHTWPPDAHMAAPSSVSMILSGVMSKTGVYGIVRILFMMFMGESVGNNFIAGLIIVWGALTMLVGASMALFQNDFKRLLAFSSVSQLGYVITGFGVGLTAKEGVNVLGTYGGIYHMLNHATFKCLLFLCAGAVLYRTGTTDLRKLGGLSKKMPVTTILFLIGAASIAGVPPFNGFVSKWIIYQATFEAGFWPITIIALIVSVMTLAYMVKLGQSVFFGRMKEEHKDVKEIPLWMSIPMGILAVGCVVEGSWWNGISQYILKPIASSLYNIKDYIGIMFNEDYVVSAFSQNDMVMPTMNAKMAGYYNPINWLILFVILLIGFILIALFNIKKNTSVDMKFKGTKYETFTGGEKEEYTHVSGNDFLWGLRHQFRPYFDGLKTAHSGVVNDYVLWVVATLAVVILYIFLVL